jgi:sensor c-di-GMP phosphodiesterase-like protein
LLCSEPELPVPLKEVLSSATTWEPGFHLDLLRPSDGQSMVRVRRAAGSYDVFATVPSPLLLPQVGVDGAPVKGYAALFASNGTLLAASGDRPSTGAKEFASKVRLDRFGIEIEVAASRELLPAAQHGLRWLGLLMSAVVLAAVGGMLAVLMRRKPDGPVADLQAALEAGEFVPYYQPIVDIRSGQLRGAEVLVRWRKPDGSLVLPSHFIPLAESSGLIHALTRDLMRRVCSEVGSEMGSRPALKISFNFAAKLLADETIVKDVRKVFVNAPIKFSQVVIEVTERDPIENFAEVRKVIAALQALGVRIAIDDVGTGHSGLSYMLKLGVDIIKIDKMFVDAIGTDRNSTTIVETLVDLAHNMRMDVVAEGVENFEQVMHLRDVGIRSAQGYVFAPPLPGSAFLQLVQAIDPLEKAESAAA